MSQPTHYEVLSLPQNLSDLAGPEQAIRQAYRRALLRHHPDKAKAAATATGAVAVPICIPLLPNSASMRTSQQNQPAAAYTIDQITTAYTTLSSPTLRSEYDTHLRLTASKSNNNNNQAHSAFQTGIETIDLDDLESFSTPVNGNIDGDDDGNEQVEWWFRPCRCGNERGFLFSEGDLEEAGDLGELIAGCQDCSLWLRVCFAVIEEDGRDDGEGSGVTNGK